MADSIKRIQAAVLDGRAQTPRFKQQQLVKLQEALLNARTSLVDAICADTGYKVAEAEVQHYLTLSALKVHYRSLDFKQMLEDEFRVANSKDNFSRRSAFGCAYIIPTRYSLLYSVIVPVSAAIAAGNCVILELPQTTSQSTSLLRKVLVATLDQETFALVDSNTLDKDFLKESVLQLDTRPNAFAVTSTNSISTPLSRVVAVVDRSAKLKDAAMDVVRARFSFRGQSPYAPDLVLVNEFCIREFCKLVVESTLSFLAGDINDASSSEKSSRRNKSESLQKDLAEESVTMVLSGTKATVAVVHQRKSKLIGLKVSEPVLLIHSISSLDDAIDLSNTTSSIQLTAAHLFAAPAAAKYLSQFINGKLSCINHVPVDLLVGPPAPTGIASSISPRYSVEMFSVARPEYFSISSESQRLASFIDQSNSDAGTTSGVKLLDSSSLALPPINEPVEGAIGYFEQGLFTGGSILLSTLVLSAVLTKAYLFPAVLARLEWR